MDRASRLVYACLAIAVVAGIGLRYTALGAGFHGDDYVQIAMLDGEFPASRSLFDLYRFADVERDGGALLDAGYLPWWAAEDLRIAMFRPLSSALLALDHAVFGSNATAYHLHSVLWWIGVMALALAVLRRALPAPAAAAAIILYAIDESHSGGFAWIANRTTSVATLIALSGLWLHLRVRDRPERRFLWLEGLLLFVALLGGEYALSTIVYVIAYELVGRDDDERERQIRMIPALSVTAAYLGLRSFLGFGVRSSGYYIDPLHSPRAFLEAVYERVPVLVGEGIFGLPARAFVDDPAGRPSQIVWGVAAIGALLLGVWWLRRNADPAVGSSVAWLALGSVLGLIPSAGALPEDRLLMASSLGTSATLGVFVAAAVSPRTLRTGAGRWGIAGVVTLFIAFVHVVGSGQRSHDKVAWFSYMARAHQRWALDADIPEDPSARVLFLSAADFTTNANLPFARAALGASRPRWYRRLSGTNHVQEITRTAPNVIEVAALADQLDDTMAGSLYRSRSLPLRRGQSLRIEGMTATVLAVVRGNPWRTRFEFDRSLDDPSFVLLHAMPDGFKRIDLPPVGEKLRLPWPAMPPL